MIAYACSKGTQWQQIPPHLLTDDEMDPNITYTNRALEKHERRRGSATASRGGYLCGKCRQPKAGHVCPFDPKVQAAGRVTPTRHDIDTQIVVRLYHVLLSCYNEGIDEDVRLRVAASSVPGFRVAPDSELLMKAAVALFKAHIAGMSTEHVLRMI